MAYSDFSLIKAKTDFGLTIEAQVDLFADVQPIAPSEHLSFFLAETISLATSINTEKARSELLIAPILLDVRRQLNYQVSLFSGVDFNVDAALGLTGFCDFILSRSTEQYYIEAPVITIVEAKNESIKSGLGQVTAEMVAAQMFNGIYTHRETSSVYGAVTSGTEWKFLKLVGTELSIDVKNYYINEVDIIISILMTVLQK